MRLRFLFTLGLVLLLSTLASSNECLRYCHHTVAPTTHSISGEYSTLLVNSLLYI
ncbi:MAG TPA: hypothetical protein VNW04_23245 [Puia sp.]|jgi:hypothetical protein|nr:hypothetical protein [Puia sp.]